MFVVRMSTRAAALIGSRVTTLRCTIGSAVLNASRGLALLGVVGFPMMAIHAGSTTRWSQEQVGLNRQLEFESHGGDVEKLLLDEVNYRLIGITPYLLQVWDLTTGEPTATRAVEYPENRLQDAAFNDRLLVVAYLVAGDVNEVVFAHTDSGRRFDPESRSLIAGDNPEARRLLLRTHEIPLRLALDRVADGAFTTVAVGYASGLIDVVDARTFEVETIETTMSNFRQLVLGPGRDLAWIAPEGLGTRGSDGEVVHVPIDNQAGFISSDQRMAMLFSGDEVKRFEKSDGRFVESRGWKMDPTESFEVQHRYATGAIPLGQRDGAIVQFDDGHVAIYGIDDRLLIQPFLPTTDKVLPEDLEITAMTLSGAGDQLIIARGKLVSVYQIIGLEAASRNKPPRSLP